MSSQINNLLLANVERYVRMILPNIKKVGNELECGDIDGNKGSSFKVNINTGKWGDFATDLKGNQIVGLFIAYFQRNHSSDSVPEAMRWIESEILGFVGSGHMGDKGLRNTNNYHGDLSSCDNDKATAPDFLYHKPDASVKPNLKHFEYGLPDQTWEYRDFNGDLIGFVCRYNHQNGKDFIPWSFGEKIKKDGTYSKVGWKMKQQEVKRKLYNLQNINLDKKSLIVCEGEKTADFIAKFFQNVTTWSGGSKAFSKSDWSWVKDMKVILCPDNDDPGYKAMHSVSKTLKKQGCTIKFCIPTEGKPEGWDYADFDGDDLMKDIKSNLHDNIPLKATDKEVENILSENSPSTGSILEHTTEQSAKNAHTTPREKTRPFEVLGSDNDKVYMLNHKSKRIFAMSTSEMTEKSLYRLAPKMWWDANYAYELGKKPDMLQACDDIIQEAYDKPFFDGDRIRGRGVWVDHDTIIMNSGDAVYENGIKDDLGSYKTKNHYIASKPFDMHCEDPATHDQIKSVCEVFKHISMKGGLIGQQMLLGWCISAQICGALDWRPHIWLTGRSGSGKSWIMEKVIQNIIASRAIYPEAGTSEAGIRQALASDALAVVYEEAESNSASQAAKIQSVIELARTASSSSKRGAIYKGSNSGGIVQHFKVRSSFCFLGIQPALQQKADISRITMIEVVKDNNDMRYARLAKAVQELTPELCDALFLWVIKNIDVFLENIKLFTAIVAREQGGGARNGDQIGTLLACAWTVENFGKRANDRDIMEYIVSMNWSDFDNINDDPDDAEILQKYILQQHVRVETKSGSIKTRKISSVINAALGNSTDEDTLWENDAKIALDTIGIYVKKNYKDIGDVYGIENNINIRKMLKDSAWSSGFMQTLRRHPDAINEGKKTKLRTADGLKSCVVLKHNHDNKNGDLF